MSGEGQLCQVPGEELPVLRSVGGGEEVLLRLDGTHLGRMRGRGFEELREVARHDFLTKSHFCPLCRRSLEMARPKGTVRQLFWDVALVACPCGLLQKNFLPRDSVLQAIYTDSYGNFGVTTTAAASRIHAPRLRRLPRKGGRLLDVGCGAGGFALAARTWGLDAHGIDPFLPETSQRRVSHLHRMTAAEAAETGVLGQFDLVTLWAVWEHLKKPLEVLRASARLLRPGGHIVLNSPWGESLHARLAPGSWYMSTLVEHLHFLTTKAAGQIAERLGLRLDTVRWAGTPFPLGRRGAGVEGQGLTRDAIRRIFAVDRDSGGSAIRADPASFAEDPQGGAPATLAARVAQHPTVGAGARRLLRTIPIGDHIELVFTKVP